MYKFIRELDDSKLRKAYYMALGRERYGTYKADKKIDTTLLPVDGSGSYVEPP